MARWATAGPSRTCSGGDRTASSSCSLPGCGSRISSTTTSAGRRLCIIPYATQMGEISFCAYNTGIGWRQIVEKMHMTATLTKWYEEHGRHEIFAGNKARAARDDRALPGAEPPRRWRPGPRPIWTNCGIAKNAREEQLQARRRKSGTPEERRHHEEMARLLPPARPQGGPESRVGRDAEGVTQEARIGRRGAVTLDSASEARNQKPC